MAKPNTTPKRRNREEIEDEIFRNELDKYIQSLFFRPGFHMMLPEGYYD